ncbi:MAG TPA: DUF4231 domain-containing protein [Verrucomicrobiota bacterium]|nr:hypothetical protein [Verrucomicrobiales bacterium]HRI14686.1 DUF4231 domain-containing protein [Verrucomicrobiota bacterium]
MSNAPPPGPAASPFEQHLRDQVILPGRAYTFDMDDGPERAHLAKVGPFGQALEFLESGVQGEYAKADADASAHQRVHRWLARCSIVSGALAVMLAIIQQAVARTIPQWAGFAAVLEGIAALAGLVAVCFGLYVKHDKRWFVHRHVAERLRMIKFLALGQADLWAGQVQEWKSWVEARVADVVKIRKLDPSKQFEEVKDWAKSGEAEPVEPVPPVEPSVAPDILRAGATYYQWKRVEYQARYFETQAGKLRKQVGPLHHWGVWFFFGASLAVLVHLFADWRAAATAGAVHEVWHFVGVWGLAAAALLPVVNLSRRVWIGAFELVHSASLFEAKQRALKALSAQLHRDCENLPATMHHIAHVEHFLEHEHREWLRLLLEAEWFL